MTNYSKGFAATSGAVLATTGWGVPHASALGALKGFAFNDEDMKTDAMLAPDEQADGQVTEAEGDKVAELVAGPRSMDMTFEGLELFLGAAMGTTVTGAQVAAYNAYLHVMKPKKHKEGTFLTMITNKSTHVEEFPSCKVDGFAFTVKSKERAKIQFPFISSSVHYNTASAETVNGIAGVNTLTTAANITLPANYYQMVLFRQMKVLINLQSGSGLAAGTDDIYPNEFSLNLANNMAGDEISTRRGYMNDEPLQDGKSQFTGSLAFGRLADDAGGAYGLFAHNRTKAKLKMKVEFLGNIIEGNEPFRLTFYFPCVQFVEQTSPVQGTKRLQPKFNLRFARAAAAPTGFPVGYVDPCTIELVNQRSGQIIT